LIKAFTERDAGYAHISDGILLGLLEKGCQSPVFHVLADEEDRIGGDFRTKYPQKRDDALVPKQLPNDGFLREFLAACM
jgi:hypothetical protein